MFITKPINLWFSLIFFVLVIITLSGWGLAQPSWSKAAFLADTPTVSPPNLPHRTFLPIILKGATESLGGVQIGNVSASQVSIPLYEKFEATFTINNAAASNFDFPYDPNPPPGLPGRIGLTVEGLFLPPGTNDWQQALIQPAFYYQPFERIFAGEAEGLTSAGPATWLVRFAPTQTGAWQYKLRAQDASICPVGVTPCTQWAETTSQVFTATAALPGRHGFVRVSQSDPRYFEFSDGAPFLGLGHQTSFGSDTQVEDIFDTYQANGVNLLRTWMSATGVYGIGFWYWDSWANSTLVFSPAYPGHDVAARIEGVGDAPCIFHGFGEGAHLALKGQRSYQLAIRAKLEQVNGPHVAGRPYGLVAKFGGWPKGICGEPNNGLMTLSPYWNGTHDWAVYTATFTLPNDAVAGWDGYFTVALENTKGGFAYIDEVRVTEEANGSNLLPKGGMNYHLYFDQASSWRWDYILDQAAERNLFLKLVILEKQDAVFGYIRPDGSLSSEPDDNNFYGVNPSNPNQATKVRRLHEYFWRYLSARWGYSTAVHSWELLNEGDPFNGYHYDQANALGRVIRATDPHHHLVTTSFWHSFPVSEFWANPNYPYLDYADFHAYVDTSWLQAPNDIIDPVTRQKCGSNQDCYLNAMKNDSALYHSEHSLNAWLRSPDKPVIRGESGLTLPGTTQEPDPDLRRDRNGIWLHKFLFAQVDAGALYDLYWFTDEIVANNLYPLFKRFRDFMAGIPFNSGQFVNAEPLVSGSNLRVLGQKDTANNRAFLWVDNRQHTWKRVVTGAAITPVSGTITLSGFSPNRALPVQWWNTCSGQAPASCTVSISSQGNVTTDSQGRITLTVNNLGTDMGVKIGNFPATP